MSSIPLTWASYTCNFQIIACSGLFIVISKIYVIAFASDNVHVISMYMYHVISMYMYCMYVCQKVKRDSQSIMYLITKRTCYMIRFQIFDGYSEASGSLLDLQIPTNVSSMSRSGEVTGSNFKLLIVLKIQQDDRDARFQATYDSLGINWRCDLKVTLN